MKNGLKSVLILVTAMVLAAPAGIYADKPDPDPIRGSETGSEAPASDALDSDKGKSSKATEKNKGKNKGKTKPGKEDEGNETGTPPLTMVGAVSIIVQNIDNNPVERATVKIYSKVTGSDDERLTNSKGVAKFSNLPATSLVVQVTAQGHKPYRQTIELGSGDEEVAIVLKRRK